MRQVAHSAGQFGVAGFVTRFNSSDSSEAAFSPPAKFPEQRQARIGQFSGVKSNSLGTLFRLAERLAMEGEAG
jgi:hypothetical protein